MEAKLLVKVQEGATKPTRAYPEDAGLDLYVNSISTEEYNGKPQITYGTGVHVKIPEGYVGLLFQRSSVREKIVRLANAVGVIDASYIGEITATFDIEMNSGKAYAVGEKCCQLVVVPIVTDMKFVDKLPETKRGDKGFGSTGK